MSKTTNLPGRIRCAVPALLLVSFVALSAQPAAAIVIRHDRDDASYLELGERFPAAVTVRPDGSGVLIAPDWVLTAAHVAQGVAHRSPRVEVDGREYDVSRIFVHPDWREMGPHDVGLLRLERPVEGVSPVALYSGDDEVGRVVTFVGRGDTGTGRTGPRAADGAKRGATNTIASADDDWILFDFDEGRDATELEGVSGPGDSGGPALLELDGTLYTLGVSVFSDGRGKGPGRYGVREGYTRVSTHRGWIESVISGASAGREVAIGSGRGPGVAVIAGAAVVAPGALPDSPVGALVARYLEAYNRDSDEAMAAFIDESFDETFRQSRSEQEHLELYRRLYDGHFGPLTVQQVVRESASGIVVLFRSAKGPLAELSFETSPGEPKRIAGMRVGVVEVGEGPPPSDGLEGAIEARGQAVERLVETSGDEALQRFADDHLSPELVEALGAEGTIDQLGRIRTRCANPGGVEWEMFAPNGLRIVFRGEDGTASALKLRIEPDPPHRIVGMSLQEGDPSGEAAPSVEPIEWGTLTRRLDEAEADGFAGVVLVVRDGEVVLHRGYGLANPAAGVPNTTSTVFAIGSTPIDFTKAAILKLEEGEKLSASDPIGLHLSEVPDDKRGITIGHLMNGTSGLRNFHHAPGRDADPDLTWIDRETAIRRILDQPLLFAPGEERAHSHSAWVLLAAIVEIVSGQPYGEYLKEQLFRPAGMERTGLYQDAQRFEPEELAAGVPPLRDGLPNTPRSWGPTSWLVMGSGGMVSNPGDLLKWNRALRSGKLLSATSLERHWTGGALAGGNDRGFLTIYTEGPDTLTILCSNSHTSMKDRAAALGRALVDLVTSE